MNNKILIILFSLSIILSFAIFTLTFCNNNNTFVYAQKQKHQQQQQGKQHLGAENITLYDPNLKIELVASGLDFPTTMAFLGQDNFLILEKAGTVKRVIDGKVLDKPLLQLDINEKDEHKLLGIAVSEKNKEENSKDVPIKNKDITHNVFLYYVTCNEKKNNYNDCKNQIYRYEMDNKKNILINPKLLLSIPSFPDTSNINGGIIRIGPDNNLYVTVGSFENTTFPLIIKNNKVLNLDRNDLDGRGGILRITQDGKPVTDDSNGGSSTIGDTYPLNLYYAYGIRNSLGLDFDPLTDKLWDTEIGPQFGDEINLVEPGFNNVIVNETKIDNLEYIGKGHYNLPKFLWDKKVTPTALVFLDSKSLGKKYQNDMFVGSCNNKSDLFHFQLNTLRNNFNLAGNLSAKIATDKNEYGDVLFSEGFNCITDLEVGPFDGYLYIVSAFESNDLKAEKISKTGAIFRIISTTTTTIKESTKKI